MIVYRVRTYDLGGIKRMGVGFHVRGFGSKTEADRYFKQATKDLLKTGTRFRIWLDIITVPDRLSKQDWIDFFDHGETFAYTFINDRKNEYMDDRTAEVQSSTSKE